MAIKLGILGAGKVGIAIAALLDTARFVESVVLADVQTVANLGGHRKAHFTKLDVLSETELAEFVRSRDVIVSAAPYYLNKTVARTCARFNRSYFDLTEDVDTANYVRGLAADHQSTFMPQCGLAPGAVNIIASGLANSFKVVRSVEMRVGALPLSASNQMKYYLSWSAAGLINEYCHCGEALYQGHRIPTLPLDGVEHLTIDGVEYEAFNTSGGVATMCETFEGLVGELNYKTLRYPGHRDLMKFLLYDLNLSQKQDLLTQIFDQEVPITFDDVVVLFVNSVGNEEGGLIQRSFVKKIYAGTVGGRPLSALQLSTAAGVVAVIELFARGLLPAGFVKQESIALDQFFDTQWGGRVYREAETVAPRVSTQA